MAKAILTAVLGAFVLAFVVLVSTASALFTAYAGALVWEWHIMPAFPTLPAVGTITLWALGAMYRVILGSEATRKDERSDSEKLRAGAGALLAPAVLILVAWVLR